MPETGCILLADDEPAFLEATGELLCRDGYECYGAATAAEAIGLLRTGRFDVLIADVTMHGNTDLALVRDAVRLAPGISTILITGYPSLDTAIAAVGLRIAAYLVKPLDYGKLREQLAAVIAASPRRRLLLRAIEELRQCADRLQSLPQAGSAAVAEGAAGFSAEIHSTVRRLIAVAGEMVAAYGPSQSRLQQGALCQAIGCSGWPAHRQIIRDAIAVLQDTKRRFKSKELAELRERLSCHLEAIDRQSSTATATLPPQA